MRRRKHFGMRRFGGRSAYSLYPEALSVPPTFGMNDKRYVGRAVVSGDGRRRRRIRGSGIFSDIGNWIKKNKVISKAGKFVSGFLPPGFSQAGQALSSIADVAGYGRRRRFGGANIPGQGMYQAKGRPATGLGQLTTGGYGSAGGRRKMKMFGGASAYNTITSGPGYVKF
jgi:hypothetical protein